MQAAQPKHPRLRAVDLPVVLASYLDAPQPKWLRGNGTDGAVDNWYAILPTGELKPWRGGTHFGVTLASPGLSAYQDPKLLHDAFDTAASCAPGTLCDIDQRYALRRDAEGYFPASRVSLPLFTCPNVVRDAVGYPSYGYNGLLHYLHGNDTGKIVGLDHGTPVADAVGPNLMTRWPEEIRPRHRGGANVAFFGGSIQWLSPDAYAPNLCQAMQRYWVPTLAEKYLRPQCVWAGPPLPGSAASPPGASAGGATTGGTATDGSATTTTGSAATTTSASTTAAGTTATTGLSSTGTTTGSGTSTTGGTTVGTTGGSTTSSLPGSGPTLCELDRDYGYFQSGSTYTFAAYPNTKWIKAANNLSAANGSWYVITSDGHLRSWISGQNYGNSIAEVGQNVYLNPALLHNAFDTVPGGICP